MNHPESGSPLTRLKSWLPAIIASLSAGMTLEPGDVIATGTPSGVGFGMEPKGLLKGGDEMWSSIDRIGVLKNTVVEV